MTPEEKKKADELAAKAADEKQKADEAAKVAAEKVKADKDLEEKKKADELAAKAADEKANQFPKGTFIMKVTHLSWGHQGKSHFFADKKPLISAKSMGGYAGILKVWIENGWIEKGSY